MSDKVVAKVGGVEIKESYIEQVLRSLPEESAKNYTESEESMDNFIMEIAIGEAFYQEAISVNEDSDKEYLAGLEELKRNFLKQYTVRKLLNNVVIDDAEVESFYNDNPDSFKMPEQIKASHILVETEDESKAILDRIASGEEFGDLAKEASMCPSKEVGGDLGFFGAGQMVPEFEGVAFKLSKGEIGGPVKTQFGYHLIMLTDKKDSSMMTYEDAKDKIKSYMIQQKQNEIYIAKATELKSKYAVEVFK